MLNQFEKIVRVGGIRYASGAIPMAHRVIERVLRFHQLSSGKSKFEMHVGNELRDRHHLYMGL